MPLSPILPKWVNSVSSQTDGSVFPSIGGSVLVSVKGITRYIFMSVKSKLTLTPHPQLNNYVRSNKRFPNYPELFTIGFKGNWLAFVDITDRRKWDYLAHTENIYEGINLLQRSVTLDVMTLEIAIDTLDTELGMFIRKHGCLNKPPRDTAIFHFESNSKKKIDGPSVDGCNE